MVVSSPESFVDAVAAHEFGEHSVDSRSLGRAQSTLAETGLLLVGEPDGVWETPSVLYRLATALGTRALALEWSHEEMEVPVQTFLHTGSFDFEHLWSLPPSAEFFCGDGRITAGHFALLRRLRDEGRLDQMIAFDRLDAEPVTAWQTRDREMADRLLAEWDGRHPLLVLTGAFHAQLDEGGTMAARLARTRRGVKPAMLDYAGGECWSRGETHDVSGPMPDAPIMFRLRHATPAVVPGVSKRASCNS